tara:strand:+ start:163 stop:270 length:108 start_codon:yes stop_codon:yes gene_type:complete
MLDQDLNRELDDVLADIRSIGAITGMSLLCNLLIV